MNDSVIGDPQFTVSLPVNGSRHMCYEVHGVAGQFFNLISDTCTSVNALFAAMPGNVRINRMSSIGIHAVTTATPSGSCADIQIDLENCTATLNGASIDGSTIINDIRVRKFGNRWRVSVPNCERPSAVMWITCQRNPDMLRFDIARGSNLRPTSHGLLGKYTICFNQINFVLSIIICKYCHSQSFNFALSIYLNITIMHYSQSVVYCTYSVYLQDNFGTFQ